MEIRQATDAAAWDAFLASRRFRPFLQSWTMGDVYGDIGQEPIRLEAKEADRTIGICMAHLVPAKRGRHLSVPYGPVVADARALAALIDALKREAKERGCAFVRVSPFLPSNAPDAAALLAMGKSSPLHLLAEHIWYLPLHTVDPWSVDSATKSSARTEEDLLAGMRPTARNLIRRAQKEGVEIQRCQDPRDGIEHFLALHEETRLRHGFTPYSVAFFRAQVTRFAERDNVIVYLARYKGEVIASSIHMRFAGETSYHHGASTQKYRNIPASYLLQWTAIREALLRGDDIYNFWGISPEGALKHPFAGVRTFKTAFGGSLLELLHCVDLPLSSRYAVTRAIETWRKWRRGF